MRQAMPAIVLAATMLVACPLQAAQAPARPASDAAARAEAARATGRTSEAIAIYREALASDPKWTEGWWALGTLLYDTDAFAEAAAAFEQCTTLEPGVGTAWVMLGLAEYRLDRDDVALAHIQRGRRLGVPADPQFRRVMLYHEGILLLGTSEFEQAQEVLARLSSEGVDNPDLTIALGMSVLRLQPPEVPESSALRAVVARAGVAEQLAAQKKFDEALGAYERLARDYPLVRNVQYALGRYFVARQQPDQAVAAYEREIARFRDHVPARLGIAAIKADTDPAMALRYAEEAVALNPRVPLGHYLLGTLLLNTSDVSRAIAELELARDAVPEDPGVHYALGRAYARAGRAADAARAREEFKRLDEERQAAARRDLPVATSGAEQPPR
jgi:tetratricopeptide (TPR) repeat protein